MSLNKVLIVDDSKSARLVLTRMLKNWDLEVDSVASGEEALEYLHSHRPDAIFMDHTMPGMTGLQTVKAMRENADTATIPVAMYTSKEGESYSEEVKAYNIVGILLKPATSNALQEIIEKLKAATQTPGGEAVAGQTQPMPAAAQAGLSQSAIEELTKTAAESVIDEAIRMQILPLLEEKLFQLKEDLAASNEKSITEMAGKIYDSRFSTLYRHLAQQVVNRTAELRARLEVLEKPGNQQQDKVQTIVEQGTNESRKMLVDYIEKMEEKLTQRITQDVNQSAKTSANRIIGLSGLAIALSIAAIGLVFFYAR